MDTGLRRDEEGVRRNDGCQPSKSFLSRLLSVNDGVNRFVVTLASLCFIAVVVVLVWLGYRMRADYLSVGTDDAIDETPNVVEQMKEIGQWEFLAISDEELVDTVRTGFFSDDELVRIYYGTLRLGIDFSQCSDEWIEVQGDSVVLTLPDVKLLDEDFLDETRTRSFFESGKWSNADRKDMAVRARNIMRKRCLTKANLELAQKNAEQQIRAFVILFLNKNKKL